MKTEKFQTANSPAIENHPDERDLLANIIEEAQAQTVTADVVCNSDKGYVIYREERRGYTALSVAKIVRIDQPQPVLRMQVPNDKTLIPSYFINDITLEEIFTLITQ